MALAVHLWTKGAAPPAWLTYVICSRFHVLPSQVAAEPFANVVELLTCMEMEQQVETRRRTARRTVRR